MRTRWKCFGKPVALLVLLSLLYGGVRGFYSWDYFTLWGVHAKSVWASGRFFLPGLELPLPFPYQSLLGSVVGWLARVLSPGEYPDYLFGLANVALVVTLLAVTCRQATRAWTANREQGWVVGVLALALIRPVEWSQLTWGGYQDLSAALALTLGVLALLDGRARHYVGWALLGLALRPVNWPWWIFAGGIWSLRQIPRDALSRRSLWAVAVPVGAFLIIKLAYRSTFLHPMASTHLSDYTLTERLLIPWGILKTQTGAILPLSYLALRRRREIPQLGLFLLASLAYLLLIYTFVMGRTGTETYASIHRYTLPAYLVAVFALLRSSDEAFRRRPQLGAVFLALLGLAGLVRGLEDIPRVRREGGVLALASFTGRYPEDVKTASELVRQMQGKSDCPTAVWEGVEATELPRLRTVYAALPQRILFPVSLSGTDRPCAVRLP